MMRNRSTRLINQTYVHLYFGATTSDTKMSNRTPGLPLNNTKMGHTAGYSLNSTTTAESTAYNRTTLHSTKTPPHLLTSRTTTGGPSGSLGTTTGGDFYNSTLAISSESHYATNTVSESYTPTNTSSESYTASESYNATSTSTKSYNATNTARVPFSTSDIVYNQTSVSGLSSSDNTFNSSISNASFPLAETSTAMSKRAWTEAHSFSNHTSDISLFNSTIELNSTAQPSPVQSTTLADDFVHYAKTTHDEGFVEIVYSVADLGNNSMIYNSTDNFTDYNNTGFVQINYKHPVLGVILCLFVVVVIVGNLLVIAAVARERYLRSVTNYLIVSLAVADLLVGGIVMPFSIILEMTNGVWLFNHIWCDLWHSFDVLGSTGSILNLCVIALDRYWAITDPIAYPTKMSNKRVWILISLVWVCSALISFPAILWWRAVSPHMNESACVFSEDSGYLIFSSIVSFYTPLIIMLFVYYRIYKAATARTRSLITGTKVIAPDGVRGEVMTLRIHRGKAAVRNGHVNINYHRPAYTDTDRETDSASHWTRSDSDDENRPARFIKKKIQKFAIGRKLSKLAKEQKAAKTLGIVMGVFIICWVPFFVTNVLWAICRTACVFHPNIFFPIFTWLGYLNSGMNPIIYALSMRDFRRAFKRIMCSWCPNYNIHKKAKMFQIRSMSTSSFTGPSCAAERFSTVRL